MSTNVPKAPLKSNRKGDPPSRKQIRGNLTKPSSNEDIILNFKVSSEFRRDFKIAAAIQGITQSKLLIEAFEVWKERH